MAQRTWLTNRDLQLLRGPVPCKGCGIPFVPTNGRIFCTNECRRIATTPVRYLSTIPSSTVGAVHELLVCADLLRRGWSVFRNVAPTGPADLVACMGERTIRLEVTTGRRLENGKLSHPPKLTERYRYDVLVVVSHTGAIHYEPEL